MLEVALLRRNGAERMLQHVLAVTMTEKRRRKDASTCVGCDIDNVGHPAAVEVERLHLLKGVSNTGHSAGTGMPKTYNKMSTVNFEQILKESLGNEFVRVYAQQPALNA